MVKFYDTTFAHPYPFETVSLAYFLRYPNPYSTHVLSTDTLSRHYDPATRTLHTARLHLKRSKIPAPILRLLPRSLLGHAAASSGSSQSYILERSVVDVDTGVMLTESRNLEFTGVLAVVERQVYQRPGAALAEFWRRRRAGDGRLESVFRSLVPGMGSAWALEGSRAEEEKQRTDVATRVELQSRLGQVRERIAKARASSREDADASSRADDDTTAEAPAKVGFFRSWGTSSVQRSIETIGLRRTERSQPNSMEGMNVVLERLRKGGIKAVLEGMRTDKEMMVEE